MDRETKASDRGASGDLHYSEQRPSSAKSFSHQPRGLRNLPSYTSLHEAPQTGNLTDLFGNSRSQHYLSDPTMNPPELNRYGMNFETQFIITEDVSNEIDSPAGRFNPRRVYEDLIAEEHNQSLDRSDHLSSEGIEQEAGFKHTLAMGFTAPLANSQTQNFKTASQPFTLHQSPIHPSISANYPLASHLITDLPNAHALKEGGHGSPNHTSASPEWKHQFGSGIPHQQ